MRKLLEVLEEVGERLSRGGPLLVGVDFDGTLVALGDDPDAVALGEEVRGVLRRLAGLPGVAVMVVSGRSLRDVSDRVGLVEAIYAGNHGLEIRGPGWAHEAPDGRMWAARVAEATEAVRQRLERIPGVRVESKGLTSSVHYRGVSPERRAEVEKVIRQVVEEGGVRLRLAAGHLVWEIRPALDWNKGSALRLAARRLGCKQKRVIFLGDDRTDEDGFAALPAGMTARVGEAGVSSLARYRLEDPGEVLLFLAWLEDLLDHLC